MSFIIYDLILLGIFLIFIGIFLYRNKHNLKREGLLYLYKAEWGIKLINRIGNKYQKTLKYLSYVSITMGYLLMAGMLYLFGRIIWIYIFHPQIAGLVKVPPITPLIPYLPQIFKINFLPPFYFIYWVLIIAIVAIFHEFAHGIFAAYNKIRIKKTGFGFFPFFLPIFQAAFVEPDEKQIRREEKKKTFGQLAILSAGTFFNVLTAILGFLIMIAFFSLAFSSGGIIFDDYAQGIVGINDITQINGIAVNNLNYSGMLDLINEIGLNNASTREGNYLITKQLLTFPGSHNDELVSLYLEAPAIKNGLTGPIIAIDEKQVKNINELSLILSKHSPGDKIIVESLKDGQKLKKTITLEEHPIKKGEPWLGVSFMDRSQGGIINKIFAFLTQFKDPHTYYESGLGEFGNFIYNLLWWLIIISFSVALCNMLPMGIFDGGRFFYLTILKVTKSEKAAKIGYKIATYVLLLLVLLLMIIWAIGL